MNKTTKAKVDMAKKMLRVGIELSEVSAMTGLSEEKLKEIQKEIAPDIAGDTILQQLHNTDDRYDVDYKLIKKDKED